MRQLIPALELVSISTSSSSISNRLAARLDIDLTRPFPPKFPRILRVSLFFLRVSEGVHKNEAVKYEIRGLDLANSTSSSRAFQESWETPSSCNALYHVINKYIHLLKMAVNKSFRKSQLIAFDNVAAGQ